MLLTSEYRVHLCITFLNMCTPWVNRYPLHIINSDIKTSPLQPLINFPNADNAKKQKQSENRRLPLVYLHLFPPILFFTKKFSIYLLKIQKTLTKLRYSSAKDLLVFFNVRKGVRDSAQILTFYATYSTYWEIKSLWKVWSFTIEERNSKLSLHFFLYFDVRKFTSLHFCITCYTTYRFFFHISLKFKLFMRRRLKRIRPQ